jgi:Kef-type K+ transport system membrane component KefB
VKLWSVFIRRCDPIDTHTYLKRDSLPPPVLSLCRVHEAPLMKKGLFIYTIVLLVFGLGIYFIIEHGRTLPSPPRAQVNITGGAAENAATSKASPPKAPEPRSLFSGLQDNLRDPLSRLFLQLIIIVAAARMLGSLFTRFGQPAVIGEMVAGILLGPSLFGWLAPGAFGFVFPTPSLATLKLLSQIGVCIFLFVVGMDLDLNHLRDRAQTAVVVSHVSIFFPYFLGVSAALFLFSSLAAPGTSFMAFALFMGISMSITAFPVLARILEERGLSGTSLGSTAITCAAVDDVTAWSILAFVVAIVKAGGLASSVLTIGLVLAFVGLMLFVVRPGLPRWIGTTAIDAEAPGKSVLAGVLAFLLSSALVTEVIGIHALFGAFLAGVVMPPKREFRHRLKMRIENFSSVFLLPLFFAFTGLRTQIGLLNDSESWLICLGIICIATLGKLGGSMVAARLTGMGWNDAFALGALMNTRGLMELIALNIGFDLGILSPRIFAMLVLMALVTTFLTAPLLTLAEHWKSKRALAPGLS